MRANEQKRTWQIGNVLLVLGSALVAACTAPAGESAGTAESKWGHLAGGDLTPQAPQFLVNKKPGESFRVCLPNYMVTAFPGVESEIYAAINVWGSYLGRTVAVEIVKRDLPRAAADQDPDAVSKIYNDACGDGFDVVVGMAKLGGSTVGLTGFSYSFFPQPDGTKQITSFQRYLFLRDYDISPDANDVGARWVSVQGSGGTPQRGEDLLATMTKRSTTQYAHNASYLTLPVLTHEFGHVWGMCDQYEGSTNCDPVSSTSHMVLNSIMGARSGTQHLFLTDDDIEGIRALEARSGFAEAQAATWGTPASLSAPAAPINVKDVELLRLESVTHDAGGLHVTYGVVTRLAAKYEFFLLRDGDTAFTPLTSDEESDVGFDAPNARMNIGLGADDGSYTVRLRLSSKNVDGTWTVRQTQDLKQSSTTP